MPDDRVRFQLEPRARPAERVPTAVAGNPTRVTAPPAAGGEAAPPAVPAPPVDSGTVRGERLVIGRVRPEYGRGLLWVRPVPVSPRDLARRLESEHFELVDSAVTVMMQAFLDSIAAEPGADRLTLPSWTTNVAGSKFGLDSRYIYIAGLKIPAALLALLPLPQGNIDQAKAYSHLMDLRADIEQAARRAENMDQFKRAIRDTRERNQRQRDFERAQREPPPPRDQPEQ